MIILPRTYATVPKLSLSTQQADNIEFISVDPSICDLSRGKGYNEMILIYNAVLQSRFIQNAKGFFKVTGRYPIYNLHVFISKAEEAINNGYKLYCDLKDHKLYDWLHLGWCGHSFDCRLFGCTTPFFLHYFWPNLEKCNDYNGHLLEDVLFDATKSSNEKQIIRFHCEPHFGGLAGHQIEAVSFSQNHDNLKSNLKRFIGNCIRIFIPWFKF